MKLSKMGAVLGCVFSLCCSGAFADQVNLKAPQSSNNGSFVLRVESEVSTQESAQQGMQLEIYRNKDGGEYSRILRAPHFSALSEMVREDGRYGYKARWVSQVENAQGFSDPVYIDVTTLVPRVVKRRSDTLASAVSPASAGVY